MSSGLHRVTTRLECCQVQPRQ